MIHPMLIALPARLRAIRIAIGLTQEEFAEKSGISYKYYQALEAGRKLDLRFSTIVRLAEAHGMEPWELLRFPETKSGMKRQRIRRKSPTDT